MNAVIYIDILLAINWIVDYFLLVGTAVLTGCMPGWRRLLLGGALGGASALIFLAPPLPLWVQLLYQLAAGTAVLLAAFRERRLRSFARLWFWYFLLNLCYSGLVLAAVYWLSFNAVRRNNLAFYYDVPPLLLVGCILVLYFVLRLVLVLFDAPRSDKIVRTEVLLNGETLYAEVLIDSGMSAQDALLEQPLLLLSWPDTLQKRTVSVKNRQMDVLRTKLEEWFSAPVAARMLPAGLRLVPLRTAAGMLLAPALTVQAVINGCSVRVTLAFCKERFRTGQVQGLFGAQSYERLGGR